MVGVAGASLTVETGEVCVIMGLSGSGKSTLVRAVNGLNQVTRGRVLVQDREADIDITRCDAQTIRRLRTERIAMVFQQFALLPWRTVAENVGLGLELRGMPRSDRAAIVDQKLSLVGLEQVARQVRPRALGRHAAARGPGPRLRHRCRHSAHGTSRSPPLTR